MITKNDDETARQREIYLLAHQSALSGRVVNRVTDIR